MAMSIYAWWWKVALILTLPQSGLDQHRPEWPSLQHTCQAEACIAAYQCCICKGNLRLKAFQAVVQMQHLQNNRDAVIDMVRAGATTAMLA